MEYATGVCFIICSRLSEPRETQCSIHRKGQQDRAITAVTAAAAAAAAAGDVACGVCADYSLYRRFGRQVSTTLATLTLLDAVVVSDHFQLLKLVDCFALALHCAFRPPPPVHAAFLLHL